MLAHRRVALLVIGTLLLFTPLLTSAVGTEADMMCNPVDTRCGCGVRYGCQGKTCGCIIPGNMHQCPCFDTTSGFKTSGICVAQNKCLAQSTSDGKMDQGMQQLTQMLSKLMEQLMKGGQDSGGGGDTGGATPLPGQTCTTLQPTPDQFMATANPGCYYYQPPVDLSTTTATIDPSGGLVASPTEGAAPLAVYFAYTNGTSACNTPGLVLEFDDGATEQVQLRVATTCNGVSETAQHTYTAPGTYEARLKNAATGEVRGGVNITVSGGETTGSGTATGGTNDTSGNNSNIGNITFTTPLTNLNTSGSVSSTGGSTPSGAQQGTVTTGNNGAQLNFNSPQSIVQSIIQKVLPPGAYGDVKIMDNGTTIIAGTRDQNSEVVGFYGTNSTSGGTSAIAHMCVSRPWATNFLSYIIPASFFDSLCTWRGYSTVKTQQNPAVTPSAPTTKPTTIGTPKATTTKPAASTTAPVTAKVDIWASPASVPLGARTSIFWTSQGVTECIVRSPDGSFSQTSLKGGASTVPLTAATTFTISCIAENGAPVTDNVTVLISI